MKTKKSFRLPDTYIIIFGLILVITVLARVLPSSEYGTVVNAATGKTVIDPNAFHYVDKPSFTFDDLLNSLLEGFDSNALLILGSFCTCGFFSFIIGTGALDRSFSTLADKLKERKMLLIPFSVFIFCLTGSTGMLQMESIALLPVTLTIARILNLDPLVSVAIIYCGTYSGYATSMYSIANVLLAQQIADVAPLSGLQYRAFWWCVSTIVTCIYVTRYAVRVRRDINLSLLDPEERRWSADTDVNSTAVSRSDLAVVALTVLGFSIYIYKAITKGYDINYIVGVFLIVTALVAFVTRTSASETIRQCIAGASTFTYGGLLMGFSGTIAVIMTKNNMMTTIVHALSVPLSHFPPIVSGILMYVVNLVINFFITSTSGKAPMVMPLMAPLADVIGLSRQMAVSAFVLACGIGCSVIPTHSVLIAMISMAGVPFKKWLRFQFPLFLIWSGLAALQIAFGVILGIA